MIRKRGSVYYVYVYDKAAKGEKRFVGRSDTLKGAKKLEIAVGDSPQHTSGTVASYAEKWLKLHPRKRQTTMIQYKERIEPFVRDFSHRTLGSITRLEAREWSLDHRSCQGAVRAMYSDAVRDGLVNENPFAEMRLEKSRGRRDLDVMSVEEVHKAIEVARMRFPGSSFPAFVATAAFVGMRPGELYALTWDAINFDASEIEVRYSYSTRSGETTAPKNDNQRTIVLFPESRDELLKLAPQAGPVFRTVHGKQLTGKTLYSYWDPIRTAIGRPGESFYGLRHFCATHLLNTLGHEAEDVAYQLGHTDGGVLVRTLYGHPSELLARERLKQRFGRKVVPLRAVEG